MHGGALDGIHVPALVTRATAAERLHGVLRPMVLKERNDQLQWQPSLKEDDRDRLTSLRRFAPITMVRNA